MYTRINGSNVIRVNKTRAKNMYENGYLVLLTMNGKFIGSESERSKTAVICQGLYDGDFNHLVADFYDMHKGELMSYTVEYYVSAEARKEYVEYRDKIWWEQYRAKKHH